MARKHILINLHTSGTSMPTDLRLGEIAVRHADNKPELIIKKNDGTFATFIDSGVVHTIVNKINLDYTSLEGRVDATETNISVLSASVETNYATKVVASGYANTAKSEAIEAAKGETTSQVGALSGAVVADMNTLGGRVDATETNISALSASVETNYATKVVASGYANTAKSEAIEAAKGETTSQVGALSGAVVADMNTLDGRVDGVETKVNTLSASVESLEEELREEIAAKVSSAYIYQGSCTYEELTGKTENTIGDVWNVTNEHTVDGVKVPAGTNYAWSGTDDKDAKWDALAGIVDMSKYTLVSDFNTLKGRVDATETNISALSASVETNYATKVVASGYANTAKSEAIEAAKSETTSQVSALSGAVVADMNTLDGRVDALEEKSLKAIESITIQNLDGVANTYTGSAVTINFENMIIDCGTF